MRLIHAAAHSHRIPLVRPLQTAVGPVADRRVIELWLQDARGRIGRGEAAPLPGWSRESFADAWAALNHFAGALPLPVPDAPASIEAAVRATGAPPSAAHALEQALLDLLAQRLGLPMAALFEPHPARSVPSARLVGDVAAARAAVAAGFRTLKIKAGASRLSEDLRAIAAIRAALGHDARLRVDANRGWDLETAEAALETLVRFDLECVEEPLADPTPAKLAALRRFGVPLAADESVRDEDDLDALIDAEAVDAVVLKPMLVGSLVTAQRMGRRALAAGLGVFVTTTLDAAVGRAGALHLAAALAPYGAWPAGLATGALLDVDIATPVVDAIHDGRLHLPSAPGLGFPPVPREWRAP